MHSIICYRDESRRTIVGNGQIRYLPSASLYLDDLEQLASDTADALTDSGHPDLASARPTGDAGEVCVPEIAVFLTAPTDSQRERLQHLLRARPRAAIAAVTAGLAVAAIAVSVSTSVTARSSTGLPAGATRSIVCTTAGATFTRWWWQTFASATATFL